MRSRWWLVLGAALPMWAHVVSMSTGEVHVEGSRLTYELRMPLYEVAHVSNPQGALLEHVRFSSGGVAGKLAGKNCQAEGDSYVCRATYEFPSEIDRLKVECTLPSVTVLNHVHILRATKGDRSDQAVFDSSFPDAEIRFRPPSAAELAVTAMAEGFWRAVAGALQLLFLASLALAARSWRELAALTGMFLVGEFAACLFGGRVLVELSPRFLEAATALTVAYLAVEILVLPKAGQRWIVVGVLGLFHGLYFAMLLASTTYSRAMFLTGVALAELIVVAALGALFLRVARVAARLRPVPVGASMLFAVGMAWFLLRLKS